MNKLMLLYHGTSFVNVPRILSQGLLPRGTKKSNWSIVESNYYESRNDAVYLSDAYAPYYANNSSNGALIEVDIDCLEKNKFYPDEDFLAHSNIHLEVGEKIEERTKYFQENLESYQHFLKDSLQSMGNCCYIGAISLSAISRVTTWCWDDVKTLHWWINTYQWHKGGVSIFQDQDQSQLYRLLTICFAKREFNLDELLLLLKQKHQMNDNFNYNEYKAILIQEMEKINIEYDKNKSISN